ncbi:MAG: phosphate/phosphite/phosphonate ABC transporter substrate-binding protein [Acidimicrobiia bacterium]
MRMRAWLVALLAFGLLAAACAPGAQPTGTTEAIVEETTGTTEAMVEETTGTTEAMVEGREDWPERLVFGFVPSQEQEELQDDIQPFIDALSQGLGIEVEGFVTTDYTGLVTAMGTGQADLGAFGPFGYVLAKQQYPNLEVLLQSIRFGSPTYHGQWFTNDPGICEGEPQPGAFENEGGQPVLKAPTEVVALQVGYTFEEGEIVRQEGVSEGLACEADISAVEGKTVAFTSESSTSGYLFPALQLTSAGLDPQEDVEPIFTGGHDGAVTAVYNGDADIGVSFDDARGTISEENPDVGEQVIVFTITDEIPNDVVAVRSELPQSLKDAVVQAISDYLETDEGKEIFDEIYDWTDVQPASESDFDIVREAAETLGITEPID